MARLRRYLKGHRSSLDINETIGEVAKGKSGESIRLLGALARGSRVLQTGESEEEEFAARTLTETEETRVLVEVRNSGPGLDPKGLDRLFNAFHEERTS